MPIKVKYMNADERQKWEAIEEQKRKYREEQKKKKEYIESIQKQSMCDRKDKAE